MRRTIFPHSLVAEVLLLRVQAEGVAEGQDEMTHWKQEVFVDPVGEGSLFLKVDFAMTPSPELTDIVVELIATVNKLRYRAFKLAVAPGGGLPVGVASPLPSQQTPAVRTRSYTLSPEGRERKIAAAKAMWEKRKAAK